MRCFQVSLLLTTKQKPTVDSQKIKKEESEQKKKLSPA